MTKDSGIVSGNAITQNWLTADGSAGRLVSGSISEVLQTGEVLKVYANGLEIGNAVVNGTQWEITDLKGYTAGWTYTAKVVSASGASGPEATQVVNTDLTEAAPVITEVFDSVSATAIANNGSTVNMLSSVKGTGQAGDIVYLYGNTSTNLLGSTVVLADGSWSVPLNALDGDNTFVAYQLDPQSNQSVNSNAYTVKTGNQLENGDFSLSNTGFTTQATYTPSATSMDNLTSTFGNVYDFFTVASTVVPLTTTVTLTPIASTSGTISASKVTGTGSPTTGLNPGGYFSGNYFGFSTYPSTSAEFNIWSQNIDVVAGKTYQFSFDYSTWSGYINLKIGNSALVLTPGGTNEYGHVTGTFTPTATGQIPIKLVVPTGGNTDFALDNMNFKLVSNVPVDPTFLSGTVFGGATLNQDTLTYTAGALDALASNDTITVTNTNLQTTLAAGGIINGGAGVDILKLAAGTTLNLLTLSNTQTVKSIQQVEVFELQGGSTLSLSANNVLSLGGANLAGYNFTSSTGGASSTGKVQFVIKGTGTDTVNLSKLMTDGVMTSGTAGNTGLSGAWADMGTTSIGGVTYKVYNHSTTSAQVLVSNATVALPATVTPVVMDMNGDGLMSYSQVKMDMNADGVLDTTAWVAAQDGVLVRDTFGDGSVRSTSQFAFARHSGETDLQGLAALFDTNQDKVLDAKDAQFGEFAVWQDADADGVADLGEVKHLIDLGISEINLVSDGVLRTPATGVTVAGHTTATLSNGSTMAVADAAFEYTLGTKAMDPGSSSGVTSGGVAAEGCVIPASASVIPASEPGSMAPAHPDHCEPSVSLPKPLVLDLNPASWNKPFTLSAEQLSELNLPAAESTATLNLSNLLGAEAAPSTLPQAGAPVHMGIDPMLQVMLDNQLHQVATA
jgi:hypothetical protein